MAVVVRETMKAPASKVWEIISDIDGAEGLISGIKKIEVLERPESGLLGFKWRETRTLFGRDAEETMTICAADEAEHWYEINDESCGVQFNTRMRVMDKGEDGCELVYTCVTKPVSMCGRILSWFSFLFVGSMKACVTADFADIKRAVE